MFSSTSENPSICTYDERFIVALFSDHFGKPFTTMETDCWCTGDRIVVSRSCLRLFNLKKQGW